MKRLLIISAVALTGCGECIQTTADNIGQEANNTREYLYERGVKEMRHGDAHKHPSPRDGVDGVDGQDGVDGLAGAAGEAGRDGLDGATGAAGEAGKDGLAGIDGIDGIDGQDGIDGLDGRDGQDGRDGVDASNLESLDPCGDHSKYEDEILLKDGDAIYAWHKNVGLIQLDEGVWYQTTDKQKCYFKIEDGEIAQQYAKKDKHDEDDD